MSRIHIIVWGLLAAFGAFIVRESLQHNYYGSDFGPGPGFFSFWLGILLILLAAAQIVLIWRRPRELLPDGFVPDREGVKRMLSIIGALVMSLLLLDTLGFSLTMLGFCVFLLRRLGRQPWWLTLTLSLVSSFGMTYLFGLLQVMLPRGFLGFI